MTVSKNHTADRSAPILVVRTFASLLFGLAILLLSFRAETSEAETIRWAAAGSGDWNVAANWSPPQVPLAGDDVIIDDPNGTVVVTLSNGDITVRSIQCSAGIKILTTTLALTGSSLFSGSFVIDQGSTLNVQGPLTVVTVSGATKLDSTALIVGGGAKLNFPTVTTYEIALKYFRRNNFTVDLVSVSGTGSRINFPKLELLKFGDSRTNTQQILSVSSGAVLDLSALKSVEGDSSSVSLTSVRPRNGGQIILSKLENINTFGYFEFDVEDQSLSLPVIKSLRRTKIAVSAKGVLSLPQVTRITSSEIQLNGSSSGQPGGVLHAPLLDEVSSSVVSLDRNAILDSGNIEFIDDTAFALSNGAILDKIIAKSWTVSYEHYRDDVLPIVSLTGNGSRLDLSSIETLEIGEYIMEGRFKSRDGGVLDLSGLKTIKNSAVGYTLGGETVSPFTSFDLLNSGRILLGNLETISSEFKAFTQFNVSNQSLSMPSLSSIEGGSIVIADNGLLHAPNLVSLPYSYIELSGNAVLDSGNLQNITKTRFMLSGGAKFNKIGAKTYNAARPIPSLKTISIISLSGANTELDLSSVETLTLGGPTDNWDKFEVNDGARLKLSGAKIINWASDSAVVPPQFNFKVQHPFGIGGVLWHKIIIT